MRPRGDAVALSARRCIARRRPALAGFSSVRSRAMLPRQAGAPHGWRNSPQQTIQNPLPPHHGGFTASPAPHLAPPRVGRTRKRPRCCAREGSPPTRASVRRADTRDTLQQAMVKYKKSPHGSAVRVRSPPTAGGGFNGLARLARPCFRAVIRLLFLQGGASRGDCPRRRAFFRAE